MMTDFEKIGEEKMGKKSPIHQEMGLINSIIYETINQSDYDITSQAKIFGKYKEDDGLLNAIDGYLAKISEKSPEDDLWNKASDINNLIKLLHVLQLEMEI